MSTSQDYTDAGDRDSSGQRLPKRKRLVESVEEYTGSNITTTFTQPGAFLIEPLDDDPKCIKVNRV